jgi:hypothetical protein
MQFLPPYRRETGTFAKGFQGMAVFILDWHQVEASHAVSTHKNYETIK